MHYFTRFILLLYAGLRIRIRSDPDLFGRIRKVFTGSGSGAGSGRKWTESATLTICTCTEMAAHLNLLALCEPLLAAGPGLAHKGHGLDGGPVLAQARHHLVHRVPSVRHTHSGYRTK